MPGRRGERRGDEPVRTDQGFDWRNVSGALCRREAGVTTAVGLVLSPIDDTAPLLEDTARRLVSGNPAAERYGACTGPTLMASRILIVDPDDHLRESLRLHLSLEGCHCDTRSDLGQRSTQLGRIISIAVVNLMTF
jgi:hypothetical protein